MISKETVIQEYVKFCNAAVKNGYQPFGGNCMDLAVGLALALEELGEPVSVILLLRQDEINDTKEILSHVVVGYQGDTIDASGSQAIMKWERDFNETQRMNGDPSVEFYQEEHSQRFLHVHGECLHRFNMNAFSEDLMGVTYSAMLKLFSSVVVNSSKEVEIPSTS